MFRAGKSAEPSLGFAVVDVETTGLFQRQDRIVELAIVRLDPGAKTLGEFATLLNPERDIGPTHIHGIVARDVLQAPRFQDIAGDVCHLLSGVAIVAHNASFDLEFLSAEFKRLGHTIPTTAAVCTLRLARMVDGTLGSYKLSALSEHFGLAHEHAHSALDDARATAALFRLLLWRRFKASAPPLRELGCDESAVVAPHSAWPALQRSGRVLPRTQAQSQVQPSHLSRVVSKLVPSALPDTPAAVEYVDLLNRVLEDRRVTHEEADLLVDTAIRWGLSRDDVLVVHHDYLMSLVEAIREDGVVTEAELDELGDVAALLGYSPGYAQQLLEAPQQRDIKRRSSAASLKGLSVCFTGESQCTLGGVRVERALAEQLAARAGLVVKPSVTKQLDILVLADPDSLSGKARKARQYGTRLIAEEAFWREIGVSID